jgi:hypothetical protein
MKEAFLAAAVCVMIFSAIAGNTELLTTPSGAGLIAAIDASDPPHSFVRDVSSSFD